MNSLNEIVYFVRFVLTLHQTLHGFHKLQDSCDEHVIESQHIYIYTYGVS